jgi:hypothetical protein
MTSAGTQNIETNSELSDLPWKVYCSQDTFKNTFNEW